MTKYKSVYRIVQNSFPKDKKLASDGEGEASVVVVVVQFDQTSIIGPVGLALFR